MAQSLSFGSAICCCCFDLLWWKSRYTLLMGPNKVETAVQCFRMSCISVRRIFWSWEFNSLHFCRIPDPFLLLVSLNWVSTLLIVFCFLLPESRTANIGSIQIVSSMLAIKRTPTDYNKTCCLGLAINYFWICHVFMGIILWLYQTKGFYYILSCYKCNQILLKGRRHLSGSWKKTTLPQIC